MDSKDMLGMNCFHPCLKEQKDVSEGSASLTQRHTNASEHTAAMNARPLTHALTQCESITITDPHMHLPPLNARNCPNTHETSARTESHFFSHKPGHIQPIHCSKVNEFGLTLEQMNDLISSFQEMREIPEPDIFEYFVNDISDPDADLQNQSDPVSKENAQSNSEELKSSIAVKQAGLPFPTPLPTRGTTPAARFKTLPNLQNMSPFHTDQVMLYAAQHPLADLAPARNDSFVSCALLEGKCMSSSPKQMIPISPSDVLKHISTYTMPNSTVTMAAAEVNLNGFTNITPTAQSQTHQQSFHSYLNPVPQSSPTPSPCEISQPMRPKKQLPLNLANPVKLEISETSPAQSSSSSVTSAAARQSTGTERRSIRRGKQCRNACVHCKRSNKKCEDVRPCLRCVQTGMEDSCEDAPRKMRHGQRRRGPYRRKEEVIAFDYSAMERKMPERLSSVSSTGSPIVKSQREVLHFLPRVGYFD